MTAPALPEIARLAWWLARRRAAQAVNVSLTIVRAVIVPGYDGEQDDPLATDERGTQP